MTLSVLFHVQHLLGIGHLQRSLRIAAALARDGIAVTLVSGGAPTTLPVDPAVRLVQLPPVHASDARFALLDDDGRPLDDALCARRRAALLAAYRAARPDAVIIEGFPFARRAFRFELDPLIAALRAEAPRPRLLCSLRDIVVVRDDPARHREIVERVRRDFDAVLVHGDPDFIPLDLSFASAPQIADRLVYTGYVSPPDDSAGAADEVGAGEVIVSAGGGAAGQALLKTALAARQAGCLADAPWRLLAGGNLPAEDFAALAAAAPAGVVVERFRPNLRGLLQRCRVSVSQAGYNTVLDILAARAPAVLVPFAAERESEQLLRAEHLAALGAVELVRESELTTPALAAAIERAAAGRPASVAVATDGATRSTQVIVGLIRREDLAGPDGRRMVGR